MCYSYHGNQQQEEVIHEVTKVSMVTGRNLKKFGTTCLITKVFKFKLADMISGKKLHRVVGDYPS
jgi:hypothetical protein